MLAATLYPGAMKKAQDEIDAVVGRERVPNFADRQSLPYVRALCKEVMRWRTVAPLGVPHRLSEVSPPFFFLAPLTISLTIRLSPPP